MEFKTDTSFALREIKEKEEPQIKERRGKRDCALVFSSNSVLRGGKTR